MNTSPPILCCLAGAPPRPALSPDDLATADAWSRALRMAHALMTHPELTPPAGQRWSLQVEMSANPTNPAHGLGTVYWAPRLVAAGAITGVPISRQPTAWEPEPLVPAMLALATAPETPRPLK